jgi:hypothetical protein
MLRPFEAVPNPAVEPVPATPGAVLVDVVLLTADPELLQATKHAVGERNPIWRARTAERPTC